MRLRNAISRSLRGSNKLDMARFLSKEGTESSLLPKGWDVHLWFRRQECGWESLGRRYARCGMTARAAPPGCIDRKSLHRA